MLTRWWNLRQFKRYDRAYEKNREEFYVAAKQGPSGLLELGRINAKAAKIIKKLEKYARIV